MSIIAVIQIQHLLKLNIVGFLDNKAKSNSNTTLVKVKLITCIFYAESFCDSNTTLVKVK